MELNEIKEYISNNFIKDGKLQSTTSKSYLYKNHKIVYECILDRTEYLGNDAKFSERVYHILNDIYNKPICNHPECANSLKFYTFAKPYRKTCSNKCGVFVNKLVKLEKYGDIFIKTIIDFQKNKTVKTKKESNTYKETLALFQSGISVDEIAIKRNLGISTIASHLAKLYIDGHPIDLSSYISHEEITQIRAAKTKLENPNALKPYFEYFEEQLPYDKIRLALAIIEKENQE